MGQTSAARQPSGEGSKYIPGVCNIGPAERAKRRQSGIIASIVTLILLAILLAIAAPKAWRLLLILPASIAATGFLQSALHFCAGFGMKGLYNVVNSAGITDNVALEEFRLKDRRKAQLIIGLSLAIGVGFARLSLLL
jgi:hypothetical protein